MIDPTAIRMTVAMLCCGMMLPGCMHGGSSSALPGNVTSFPLAREPQAGAYQLLYGFGARTNDGAHPAASLLFHNGELYGSTKDGGLNGVGTVYKISTSGAEQVLYSFPVAGNGKDAQSNLIALRGLLYGTTYGGGGTDCAGGCGSVYLISTAGAEKILYGFTGSNDVANPIGGLVAVKGRLYGTSVAGGCISSSCLGSCNCGTVFALSTSGSERLLHAFQGRFVDGGFPQAGLTYLKGALYGATLYGVFRVSTTGAFQTVYQFRSGSDGYNASGDLLAVNGALYGTTQTGGTGCGGRGCGTVFKVSASGKEKVLYRFKGGSDGRNPAAGVIAIGSTLYGTTTVGGRCSGKPLGCGTIFSVSASSGAERVLYRFKGGADGEFPGRGSLIDVSGAFYGTTENGGIKNSGTVFRFTP